MLRLQLIGEFEQWRTFNTKSVDCRPVPSFNEHHPEITSPEVRKIKENVSEGFVHLLVVMPMRGDSFKRIANEFYFDCRSVRLNLARDTDFRFLEWHTMQSAVEEAIEFEVRWRSVILPKDLNSCLLLPPPCFQPRPELKDFWKKCDIYGNTSHLGEAHDLLGQVTARHRKSISGQSAYWLDDKGHRYAQDKALHGRTEEERSGFNRHRFCFPIPPGFHYDVVKNSGGSFNVPDYHGKTHNVERANIDPWGKVMPRA
jgi:hypothetical protein